MPITKQRRAKPQFSLETPTARLATWVDFIVGDHAFLRLPFRNWHAVSDQLYRSNHPWPHQLRAAKAQGVRTIINLRGRSAASHFVLEEAACRDLDLDFVVLQAFSRDMPSKEMITEADHVFSHIQYPALIHCKSGADRAGLVAALYLLLKENANAARAKQQLSWRYLHIRWGKTGILDAFLDVFARAEERGMSFRDWVAMDYDPAAEKARFLSTWWGNILTETLLRHE